MFKISKINQLIDNITSDNRWIDIHMITDDKEGLWLFKSEINMLLKSIGYEELHPRDIDTKDTCDVIVNSDSVIPSTHNESNDTLIKVDAFLRLIDTYTSIAKSYYNNICNICIHNKSKIDEDVIDSMKESYVKCCMANYKLEQLKITVECYVALRNLNKDAVYKLYKITEF